MIQTDTQIDNRRLKNLFINKGLQFRIIMTSLFYMFLVMMVTTGVIVFPDLYTMFSSQDLSAQHQAAQNYLVLATRIIPSTIFLFTLLFIHQLFITHRICGPLVNFTTTFNKIGNGDLSRKVVLRKGDYLKGECEAINGMIEGLSHKFREISEEHERVIQVLEASLPEIDDEGVKRNIQALLADLKDKTGELYRQDPMAPSIGDEAD
jgi:methyl-accepting chemotaxis protein